MNTGIALVSFKLLILISTFLQGLPAPECNVGTGGTEGRLESRLQGQQSHFLVSQEQLRSGSTGRVITQVESAPRLMKTVWIYWFEAQ